MKKGIPTDDAIAAAVRVALDKRVRVESQRELADLVKKELRQVYGDGIRVTGDRIRHIALTTGSAKVEIVYRETTKEGLPDFCPVCRNAMSPVMNMNLDGNVTEVRRNCTVCTYSLTNRIRMPGRYVFVRNVTKWVSEREERIRKLRKASAHLRAAKQLIAEAVEGTGFPERKRYSEEKIDGILYSKDRAGSIPNLVADIREEGREDPLWTEALGSPKYPRRKHI